MRVLAASLLWVATAALAGGPHVERIVDKAAGLDAAVVRVPTAENRGFALLDAPRKAKGESIITHWDSTRHVLMINGGYFSADFQPVGLCRIDGKAIGRTKPNRLSGFVAVDKAGSIHLFTLKDDLAPYPSVLQSGPYVIDPGGRIGIRSRSGRAAARTLIGRTDDGTLLIIVTKPIPLYDLSVAIKKKIPRIERLLNLDGGPSTALKTASIEVLNRWPVRNYIVMRKSLSQETRP